jgi:ADP-dependent NAD(P)H-hydrate dehydratase / NAD(P)H-hydrate epimerase
VIPIVTPEEMGGVDRAAAEPVDVLIGRAGSAVAWAARRLLGGCYGRRVVVVAGKGNNGADGRAAAARLRRWGVRVAVLDAGALAGGARLPAADLVIDAAYGTGFRGTYRAPDPGDAPVLAVDIPSGLSGDTGLPGPDGGTALRAVATVTFQALKPGLLLGLGPIAAGRVERADIGLGAGVDSVVLAWQVEDEDVAAFVPRRPPEAHKWQTAVAVIAGSPGMTGAPWLVARGALRGGAGYVRLGIPGGSVADLPPSEAVGLALPRNGWGLAAQGELERVKALVMGPGLGRSGEVTASVRNLLGEAPVPIVLDADGLNAVGPADELAKLIAHRSMPVVLTPHDGEFARLSGAAPGPDRLAAARDLASATGAVVLLKGSVTVVASPDGRALLSTAGSPRLATAGTGDVLSGVIGAFIARGAPAFEAAALAAHAHGRASALGPAEGLVAGDVPDLVAAWLSDLETGEHHQAPRRLARSALRG